MNTSTETPSAAGPEPRRSNTQTPSLLTVTETARHLRISRNLCYELVAQGRLPHVRLGRRILVPRHALEQWLAKEAAIA